LTRSTVNLPHSRRPRPGRRMPTSIVIVISLWALGGAALLSSVLLPLFLNSKTLTLAAVQQNQSWPNQSYRQAGTPSSTKLAFASLPGFTRSTVQRTYALITPESHVYQRNPLVDDGSTAHLISPAMGANFAMYYVRLGSQGRLSSPKDVGIERFVICLDGRVRVKASAGAGAEETDSVVEVGGFSYMPANASYVIQNDMKHKNDIDKTVLLVFERENKILGVNAGYRFGEIDEQPILPSSPEVFTLRKLMPDTPEYDFNIHVMDFRPGEHLQVKEVHYNQHGLLMVSGGGVYRLGDDWYPVTAGDVIWMAPFVPQWYGALGGETTRYILYKDTTVDPVLGA